VKKTLRLLILTMFWSLISSTKISGTILITPPLDSTEFVNFNVINSAKFSFVSE